MLTWPQNWGQYVKGSRNRYGVWLRDSVPAGIVHELDIPTPKSSPWDIIGGTDGNIWFAESWTGQVGKLWLSR